MNSKDFGLICSLRKLRRMYSGWTCQQDVSKTAQLIDCLASTAPETFLDLLGKAPGGITARQAGYDLRRLRAHGLIARTPDTHHYRLTDTDPPMPTVLRTAARNYQRAWAACTLVNGTEKGADDGHIRQVQW